MGVQLPSEPITRKERYLAKAAGQAVEIPAEPITREEAYLEAIANAGGGGGGTSDYSQLTNKPQINGTTLTGNKSASDLSLATTADLAGKVDKVEGYGLSENDYTDADKAIVGGVTAALADKVDKVDGKGLSSNDFTDAYKTAIGDNTTAISGIKNGEEINSFGGVESALALKQNATDNSLETEAKTIVGAINEHEGDIGSLKSGLTTLDNEVNGDATTYPYADVITIPDAVPSNLADCSVKIEPDQNLHGYDKPWVGGAGKNKLPLVLADIKTANTYGTWSGNVYTHNSVTFTVLTDSDDNVTGINVNGTTSDYSRLELATISNASGKVLNGCPSGGSSSGYKIRVANTSDVGVGEDIGSGYTIPSDATFKISINVGTGTTVSNQMFYPMLRLSTETDATFAPYTNICPISGHTEASVHRTGANLAFDTISGKNINASGVIINADFDLKVARVTSGVTYTAYTDDSSSVYAFYSASPASGSASYNNSRTEATVSNSCFEFTAPIDGYIAYRTNVGYARTECVESSKNKTYTIALGDTIYGGELDVDSGVMTVTNRFIEYDGSSDEQWIEQPEVGIFVIKNNDLPTISLSVHNPIPNWYCNSGKIYYEKNNIDAKKHTISYSQQFIYYTNSSSLSDFRNILSLTPLQICYKLETSIIIQLTPEQIQLLQGTNTLYASTGDISVSVNGVSGAIGSVQEQVNGLQEDVADIATAVATKADYRKYAISVNASSYTISDLSDIFMSIMAVSIPTGYSNPVNGLYVLCRQGNTLLLTPLHETTSTLGLTATLTDGNIVLAWTATNNYGGTIALIDLYKTNS